MNFNASYTLSSSEELLEDNPAYAAVLDTDTPPFNGFPRLTDQDGMQEFLSRSPDGRALFQLSTPGLKPDYILNKVHPPSDRSPLIPKQSHGFLCSGDYSVTGSESYQSTPKRLEELKNWLWMKHQQPFVLHPRRCLHSKWLDRSLEHLRSLIKRTPIKRWLKDRRKHKMILHNGHIQAALSVASVASALANVAAATAASAVDEKESKTGIAVASAAALVAAHCADFAENVGADHSAVVASVSSGGGVKFAADIAELTASAASSLQAVRHTLKTQKEARMHAAVSPCDTQMSPFSTVSSCLVCDDTQAECFYSHEILARGRDFLVRFSTGKLHRRFICVFINKNKRVILNLRSRHLAGAVSKTEKRIVSQILISVRAWPGRSLLHDGEERCYFGLVTSHGTIEFECESEFDHQSWTDGISHLLFMAKQ